MILLNRQMQAASRTHVFVGLLRPQVHEGSPGFRTRSIRDLRRAICLLAPAWIAISYSRVDLVASLETLESLGA